MVSIQKIVFWKIIYRKDCTFVSLPIPLNKLSCLFQLQSAEKLDEPLERLLVTIDPKEVNFSQVEEHVTHLSSVSPRVPALGT